MAAIDFASFRKCVKPVIQARKCIMTRGPHGIGKSSLAYQIAPDIAKWVDLPEEFGGKDYIYPVVERRASQMPDAGDIMGLPVIKGDVTLFQAMEWVDKAQNQPVLLYFDELDRAGIDVRQALFEAADSRKIAGKYFHPYTIIMTSCNSGPHDNNTYQVGEFDVAELDRWKVFDVAPSIPDFMKFAREGTYRKDVFGKNIGPFNAVIYDFLKENPQHIEHNGEFEANVVYPSRRSWDQLDEIFQHTDLMENSTCKNAKGETIAHPEIVYIAQSAVGEITATAFTEYVKGYERNVTLVDVMEKGQIERAGLLDEHQHMALIEKFEASKYAKNTLEGKHLTNLCRYLHCVPDEMAMKIWEVATRAVPMNGVAIHSTVLKKEDCEELSEDVYISDYMAKINGADAGEYLDS